MIEFENFFWETVNFLEENKFRFMLHGSTLLRIVRNNTVIPRVDVPFDKELNFAMLAEDFTDEHYRKLARFPYFNPINSAFPNHLIFFGPEPKEENMTDHWMIEPGFTLIARFWKGRTKRVEYMGANHCLSFPRELFEKPGQIEFKNRKFLTPQGPDKYLKFYFGEDYIIENKGWHWSGAGCQSSFDDIADELC
jgi:hypothetical protein